MKKKALITGITGQDGSLLTKFLLSKDYEVHGIIRRSSQFITSRLNKFYKDTHENDRNLHLYYGDLTDSNTITSIIQNTKPNEVYHLGAQSHVKVSFENPIYTSNVNALGTLRVLEAIKTLNLEKKIKFYNASTSELFGKLIDFPQDENTPFYPKSPYGCSKLFAHFITINYRESYKMFACNGILFNHESPVRGETFVTRKITRALTRIKLGLQKTLYLGNLDALRDWGHASDYVEMQWLILQQKKPDDFVIATGLQNSVRDFVNKVAEYLNFKLTRKGKGIKEVGVNKKNGKEIIKIDPNYYRPSEVNSLLGDSKKAKNLLNWEPKRTFDQLVEEMVSADLILAKKEKILKKID